MRKQAILCWLILKKASYETKQALEELKRQGAERIILDLRKPRGLLNEAVNICNLFVPKNEIIVTTKSKTKTHTPIKQQWNR
jgi:carboxyl-terminal processing protease